MVDERAVWVGERHLDPATPHQPPRTKTLDLIERMERLMKMLP